MGSAFWQSKLSSCGVQGLQCLKAIADLITSLVLREAFCCILAQKSVVFLSFVVELLFKKAKKKKKKIDMPSLAFSLSPPKGVSLGRGERWSGGSRNVFVIHKPR